jgi:tetratricopeptide (TPR) repeat protein
MDVTEGNLALAQHYLDIDQPRRALELLEGRQNDLDDPEYWELRATALVELDRHRDAVDAAARGLDLDPDNIGLLLMSALAHKGAGDLAAAERALLAALRLDAENPALLSQYALLVANAGQLDKARRLLDRAERIDPLAVYVIQARGVIAFLSGDDDAAAQHAEAILAEYPEEPAAHLLRGSALSQRGAARGARRHFETAARLDPSDLDVGRIARQSRVATHPLLWPVYPIQRFGPAKVWLAYLVVFAITAGLGLGWVVIPLVAAYLFMVVYSWTVAPLVVRWLERRAR